MVTAAAPPAPPAIAMMPLVDPSSRRPLGEFGAAEGGRDAGGNGRGGDETTSIVGVVSTAMLSAVLAEDALLKLAASKAFTASAVVAAGTAISAVMMTLAAAIWMLTSDASTPARSAIIT